MSITENLLGNRFRKYAAPKIERMSTLGEVAAYLRREYPGYLVYVGGHHVAVHFCDKHPTRLLLVVDAAQA